MAEISRVALFGKLNTLAYKALENAAVLCKMRQNPYVELSHWLNHIMETSDSDIHRVVKHFDLDLHRLSQDTIVALDRLPIDADKSLIDLSTQIEDAVERGWIYATLMFGISCVRTGALLVGMLKSRNLAEALHTISREFDKINIDILTDEFAEITHGSPEDTLGAHDGTTLAGKSIPAVRDIFMSYRHSDSSHAAGRMFDRMVLAFGNDRVFKDVNSIQVGARDFAMEIKQQIESARVMLVVVGNTWVHVQNKNGQRRLEDPQDYVRIELEWGLKKDIPILPILLDDTPMPDAKNLPESIMSFSKCQSTRVRSDPDFDQDMERLIKYVESYISGL